MEKTNTRKMFAAFGIILMLATSPMTVLYSQAEESQVIDDEFASELTKSPKTSKTSNKGIISEEIVDGKLEMKYHKFDQSASAEEVQKFMLEGKTHGWAYVSGKAFESGIVLYNGKVAQIDEDTWNVSTKGTLDLDEKSLNLELEGKISGSNVFLEGTATNDEFEYKIVFAGKIVESDEDGLFGLALKTWLKDPETGQTLKTFQVGEIEIKNLENISIEPELSRIIPTVA